MHRIFAFSRGSGRRRRKILRFALFLLVSSLLILFLFNSTLRPRMESVAGIAVNNRLTALVTDSVYSVLAEQGYQYEDFIKLSTRADGGVSALQVDSVHLNLALYAMTEKLLSALGEERILSLSVPLGTLLGNEFFGAKGPGINVNFWAEQGIRASFESEFTTQGINQTMHTIYFSLQICGKLLFASGTQEIDLSQRILAAQTVIPGDVPDTFTQIHRLTDEITDEDIDDVVDFGNIF